MVVSVIMKLCMELQKSATLKPCSGWLILEKRCEHTDRYLCAYATEEDQ